MPIVRVDFRLCHDRGDPVLATPAIELRIHDPEEEIALGAMPVGLALPTRTECCTPTLKHMFVSMHAVRHGAGQIATVSQIA